MKLFLLLVCSVAAGPAAAVLVTVDAIGNSSTGGSAAIGGGFLSGQAFSVTVDPNDLWSAGPLPRWSNADGLEVVLFATGTDDSGEVAGTQIGSDFGLYTQDGFSAAYGSLVGRVGLGAYFKVGTSYAGITDASGLLQLYYWDSNEGDNTQFITADVQAVPEPASLALLALGGLALRRRRANPA